MTELKRVTPAWLQEHGFRRGMQPAASNIWSSRQGTLQPDGTVIPFVSVDLPPRKIALSDQPVWTVWLHGVAHEFLNEPPTEEWFLGLFDAMEIG